MCARVDNAVHVEIEIVVFYAVGVGSGGIDGSLGVGGRRESYVLDAVGDYARVL